MNYTFHYLKGIDITQAICDSNGVPIKGTEQLQTILFNEKRISEAEVQEALEQNKLDPLIYDHKILIVDSYQNMILCD